MDTSRELLFFFSGLGAFNGLLLSLYFIFIAKPKHISNFFLGMFLLMSSIRIGKSVFFYFNHDLSFHYLQFGLTGCVFIGPFLYFYVKSVTQPESNIKKSWIYHLAVLIPLVLVVGFLYPFETHIELWRPLIINQIYHIWLAYSLLAAFAMKDIFKKTFSRKHKSSSLDIWLVSIFIGNICIWFAYYFSGYMSYILGALLFSFMLYLLVLLLVFRQKKTSILFANQEKYKNKKIEKSEASLLLKQLQSTIETEDLFTNPNLKLPDLAKRLKVLPHTLSQLLNDNVGKSFPLFLNEYRIDAAKKMIIEKSNCTLESIGYDCGFNSKSTFYATFKKMTGMTPSAFKSTVAKD